jgi:hypothetical protein
MTGPTGRPDLLPPDMLERESFWWCLKRQVKVVGGWGNAIWCWSLVWDSAREIQAEIKANHASLRLLLAEIDADYQVRKEISQ